MLIACFYVPNMDSHFGRLQSLCVETIIVMLNDIEQHSAIQAQVVIIIMDTHVQINYFLHLSSGELSAPSKARNSNELPLGWVNKVKMAGHQCPVWIAPPRLHVLAP